MGSWPVLNYNRFLTLFTSVQLFCSFVFLSNQSQSFWPMLNLVTTTLENSVEELFARGAADPDIKMSESLKEGKVRGVNLCRFELGRLGE